MKLSSSSSVKQIVASTFLALALLAVQHAAVLHWLGHSIQATRGTGKEAPAVTAADHCDACLAFSALGSGAAGSESTPVPKTASAPAGVSADPYARPTASRLAFRSRAPPVA